MTPSRSTGRLAIPALLLSLILLLPLLTACAAPAPRSSGRLRVAVAVPPQADFVERIGGDRVEVHVLIPPGAPDEEATLTPRAVAALEEADVYVAVGHPALAIEARHILPWIARLPRVRVIDMSQGLRGRPGARPDDPHVWVAPADVAVAARNLAAGLAAADPAGAPVYRAHLERFLAAIGRLDRDLRAQLIGSRAFVAYHPAWGYLAREYGLEQIPLEAEGREPSAVSLIRLVDKARAEGVRAVVVPGGGSRRGARVLADEIGGRIVAADPMARDWEGNLRRFAAGIREANHG
jgi:zinc transport system substrate-binding protein